MTLADLARAELKRLGEPVSAARPPLERLRRGGWELDVSKLPAATVDGRPGVVTATLDRAVVLTISYDDKMVVLADRVEMVDDPVWRPVRTSPNFTAGERGRLRATRGRTKAPAV